MILVDSAIDALVATFKDVGVFNTPKTSSVSTDEKPISDFLDRLIQLKIARK
jgi:hypothetical protein